jgi:hypothetical protein
MQREETSQSKDMEASSEEEYRKVLVPGRTISEISL